MYCFYFEQIEMFSDSLKHGSNEELDEQGKRQAKYMNNLNWFEASTRDEVKILHSKAPTTRSLFFSHPNGRIMVENQSWRVVHLIL